MSLVPTLRYDDLESALAHLVDVVGLSAPVVARGEDGTIAHAEVWWSGGVALLGPRRADDPFDTGRGVLYLPVDSEEAVAAHHDRVVSAGGDVVMGLTEQSYGSREFAVADPEGNVWSFGTYRPVEPS